MCWNNSQYFSRCGSLNDIPRATGRSPRVAMPRRGKPEPKRITRERFDDFLEHRLAMDITARESLRALTASLVDDMCCSRAWSAACCSRCCSCARRSCGCCRRSRRGGARSCGRSRTSTAARTSSSRWAATPTSCSSAPRTASASFGGSNLFALPIAVSSRRTADFDTRPEDGDEVSCLTRLARFDADREAMVGVMAMIAEEEERVGGLAAQAATRQVGVRPLVGAAVARAVRRRSTRRRPTSDSDGGGGAAAASDDAPPPGGAASDDAPPAAAPPTIAARCRRRAGRARRASSRGRRRGAPAVDHAVVAAAGGARRDCPTCLQTPTSARSACSVSSLGDGRSDAGAGPATAFGGGSTASTRAARRRTSRRGGARRSAPARSASTPAPPRRKRRPRDDGPPWAPAEDKAVRATRPTRRTGARRRGASTGRACSTRTDPHQTHARARQGALGAGDPPRGRDAAARLRADP